MIAERALESGARDTGVEGIATRRVMVVGIVEA